MRLGKIEKAILKNLLICHDCFMDWQWYEKQQGLARLANEDDIERYRAGGIVPLWMLRRDIPCGKTVLARALRTLHMKGLIILRDGTLDIPYPGFSKNTKYISLTSAGEIIMKTARLQS